MGQKKRCAEGERNNCRLDCADRCYLLGHSQKSSLLCGAVTASPLSAGGSSTCSEVSKAEAKTQIREEARGVIGGGSKAGWIQFCCRLRLRPAGDLLNPSPPSQPGVRRGNKSELYPGRPRRLNNEPEQQKPKRQLR